MWHLSRLTTSVSANGWQQARGTSSVLSGSDLEEAIWRWEDVVQSPQTFACHSFWQTVNTKTEVDGGLGKTSLPNTGRSDAGLVRFFIDADQWQRTQMRAL